MHSRLQAVESMGSAGMQEEKAWRWRHFRTLQSSHKKFLLASRTFRGSTYEWRRSYYARLCCLLEHISCAYVTASFVVTCCAVYSSSMDAGDHLNSWPPLSLVLECLAVWCGERLGSYSGDRSHVAGQIERRSTFRAVTASRLGGRVPKLICSQISGSAQVQSGHQSLVAHCGFALVCKCLHLPPNWRYGGQVLYKCVVVLYTR